MKTASLAVTMLLASTMITEASALSAALEADAKRKFDEAAKATAPNNLLNVDEFKVYDLSQGRPDSAVARNIAFGGADVNGDESIEWAEALAHEQMLEHFAKDPAPGTPGITEANVGATVGTQNSLISFGAKDAAGVAVAIASNAGWLLTDTSKDKIMQRSEDTAANMVANEFTAVDKEVVDKKITKKELNKSYPMWEVDSIFTAFDLSTAKGDLDIIEFTKNYRDVWYKGDICTKK